MGPIEKVSDKDHNAGSRYHDARLQPFAHICSFRSAYGPSVCGPFFAGSERRTPAITRPESSGRTHGNRGAREAPSNRKIRASQASGWSKENRLASKGDGARLTALLEDARLVGEN